LLSLFSDAMVLKHFVQIASIDASGFLRWANGLGVVIVELLAFHALRMKESSWHSVAWMSRLGERMLAFCSELLIPAK